MQRRHVLWALGAAAMPALAQRGYDVTPWPARQPVPPLQALDMQGKSWTLADLRGRAVVLNFWATWCPPCRAEMPSLQQLAEICSASGRPVTWTALLAGMLGPDGHKMVLEQSQNLQNDGVEVVPQVTCRPLMFEFQMKAPFIFESMSVFREVSAADFAGKKRLYADPEWRAQFRSRIGGGGFAGGRSGDGSVDRALAELGLKRGADPADIKAAWRKLSLENHPDRAAHLGEEFRKLAEERMRRINSAYDVLKHAGLTT